jgi:excisionase family DNA binding protein
VTRGTAYRWIREGSLPAVRVGGTVRIPSKLLVDRLARSIMSSIKKPPTIVTPPGGHPAPIAKPGPPPYRPSWIAVFRRETNDHAVLARGPHVLHDPQSKRLNGLDVRCEEIAYGLRILAANAPVTDSWGRQVA